MTDVVDLRAEVAGMPPAEALSYVLEYFDYLFPADGSRWTLEGVRLEPIEARMLRRLWMSKGWAVSKPHLMAAIYGDRQPCDWPDANIVPVYACKLRPKVEPFGARIVSEWNAGYALIMPPGVDLPWLGVEHRPGRPRKVAA